VQREQIRNVTSFINLSRFVSDTIGKLVSPNSIMKYLRSQGENLSSVIIQNYLKYLCNAYLTYRVQRYDIHGKQLLESNDKYYFEDLGIRNMLLNFRQQEDTHIMENVIYNELRLRGYSVDVGQVEIWETTPEGKRIRKNLEVDFVVNNPPQRMYIQSAFVLQDNEKTRKEERPLVNIPDHFRKIIILGNDFQRGWIDDEGVEIVSMEDFLLKTDIFE
jgi:predicted AAA+ superfamily ATPase